MAPSMQETADIAKKFVLSSVAWLAVGSILAAYFLLDYSRGPVGVEPHLKFAHAHVMLIGFVSMMIFGVAYRMLPLPPLLGTGTLYSTSLAEYHLYLANAGLAGLLVVGVAMALVSTPYLRYGITFFGLLEVLGMFLFVYNIYKTTRGEGRLPGPAGGGPSGPGPRKRP